MSSTMNRNTGTNKRWMVTAISHIVNCLMLLKLESPYISILAGAYISHESPTLIWLGVINIFLVLVWGDDQLNNKQSGILIMNYILSMMLMCTRPLIGLLTLAYPISKSIDMYREVKVNRKLREELHRNTPNMDDMDECEPECDESMKMT